MLHFEALIDRSAPAGRPPTGVRPNGNSNETQAKRVLYLTRKVGETIVINDEIRVTVVEIRGKSIKLGFTFPPDVSVLREELYERIQAENRAAAESAGELFKDLTTADKPDSSK